MKKFISAAISATILLTAPAFPAPVTADSAGSRTATEIFNDITIGWNLGDDLDCYRDVVSDDPNIYEQYWSCPPATEDMIKNIHSVGFNTVRIPVTWEQKIDENNKIADFWMDRVQEVVDYAYNDDMYVILNLQHDTNFGWLRASESSWSQYQDRFASVWEQISERFEDYDYHLMFEGFNEILNDEGDWGFWSDDALARRDDSITYVNKWNQLFVDTVRAGNGNNKERVLICNTYAASCADNVLGGDVRYKVPNDTVNDRIITDIHFYQPYDFVDDANGGTTFNSSVMQEMQAAFAPIEQYLDGPVLIDEFGTRDKGNTEDRVEYTKMFMKLMTEKGYKGCVWDSGVRYREFGLFCRNEGTWYYPEIGEAILNGVGIDASLPGMKDYSGESNLAADPYGFVIWAENDALNYIKSVDDTGAAMSVLNSGSKEGEFLLGYRYIPFKKGRTYQISFDISCSGVRSINDTELGIGYFDSNSSADVFDLTMPLPITNKSTHKTVIYTSSLDYDAMIYFKLKGGTNESYTLSVNNLDVREYTRGNNSSAHDIVDSIAVGYNLGNDLDCFTDAKLSSSEQYEWAWGNAPADAQTIKDIKDAGFDAVRLPVTWSQHCGSDMNIDSAWVSRVKEVVDEIIANDMYCIINIHHDTNLGWLSVDMSEDGYKKFEKLWTNIAAEFADYDERLLYEGFNEICGTGSDGETIWGFYSGKENADKTDYDRCINGANRLNQIFVDTVRASGGNNGSRVLVCNTYAASPAIGNLQGFIMPSDSAADKLIASVHNYEPWEFCSYDDMYTINYLDAEFHDFENLEHVRQYWVDNSDFNYPIIIGEMGTDDKNNLSQRNEWISEYLSRANDMGVKCFVWDDGQQFQLYSRIMHAWKYPDHVRTIMNSVGKTCRISSSIKPDKQNLGGETDRFHIIGISPAYAQMKNFSAEDHTFTASVTDGGGNAEDIHAEYHGMQLDMGKTYKVSFDASCSGVSSLDAAIEIGVLKTTGVVGESFVRNDYTFTPDTRHFEFEFTPESNRTDSVYSFGVFYLGGGNGAYDVTISAFTVVPADGIETVAGDVNADGEFTVADLVLFQKWLLAVPDAELKNWQAADLCKDDRLDAFDLCLMRKKLITAGWDFVDMGIAEYTLVNAAAVDVTVNSTGDETWWAQAMHIGHELREGKMYRITFTIKADSPHTFNACIQRNGGDYDTYWYTERTATANAVTVSDTFTAEGNCDDAKIAFNLGYEAGTYHISNVSLTEIG